MKKNGWLVFALVLVIIFVFFSCEKTDDGTVQAPAPQPPAGDASSGDSETKHDHSFTQQLADPTYLKSEATCTSAAEYYYSCACGEKGENTFRSGSPATHDYASSVVKATCKTEGYTLYTCDCGASYKGNYTAKSFAHDFVYQSEEGNAWICADCSLKAIEYGNADGTYFRDTNCKYYITGDELTSSDYTIFVYGTGNMPDFNNNEEENRPAWYDYLPFVKKIVIAEGITSIGAYAFYHTNTATTVEYVISDTVKTIRSYALGLRTNYIVLGKSVERIENQGILYQNVRDGVYLPKSVVYMYDFSGSITYCYEGTQQELYAITTTAYNKTISLKEYFSRWSDPASMFSIYLNAKSFQDRSEYWQYTKQ